MIALNLIVLVTWCKIICVDALNDPAAQSTTAGSGLPGVSYAPMTGPVILSGTIIAPQNINAADDAENIYYSHEDADIIIKILSHRTGPQRSQIYAEYNKLHESGIRFSSIKQTWVFRKSGSRFEDAAYVMITGSADTTFVAFLEGAFWTAFSTSYQMVMQILVTAEEYRPRLVNAYNQDRFFTLETYINNGISDGDCRNFLKELLHRTRAPDAPVNMSQVQADIDAIIKEMSENLRDNRQTLDTVLMERPRSHIRELIGNYPQLEEDIKSQLQGQDLLISGYSALIAVALDHNGYVASRIHDNFQEEDVYSTMTVFIVGYCETALPGIKVRFQEMYNINMKQYIIEQGPADYTDYANTKRFLAELVGD